MDKEEYTDDGELRIYENGNSVYYTTRKTVLIQSVNNDGTVETIEMSPRDIGNIYFELWKRNIV